MRVTNLLFSLCLDVALSASVRLTRESTSGGLERRQIDLPAAMAALFGEEISSARES
jgi:hypothetical protein